MASKQPTPSGQTAARPRSNYALFLGDLSIFCCEKDIEDAFTSYGEIINVRIQRSKETSRALSYGFIEFSCETAAVTAMNEMNGFVLKGRPLRIRWAAKRNQPVKSENTALHTAATIFVKFASQTGIIVSEQLMRDHFSVYGQILDATIRTITIDEAFNRSKGYGFVNFINDETQDGMVAAYKAAGELQNATVNGVNYRCEVGHKHQPGGSKSGIESDNASMMSMGAFSSGSASHQSMPVQHPGNFLPSLSPTRQQQHQMQQMQQQPHGYYQQHYQPQQGYVHSSASVNSAGASGNNSVSSGPSSPHPAPFYAVNPAAQQSQGQAGMSSTASVGSVGSGGGGMIFPAYGSSPNSSHPVSTVISTISFLPTPAMPNIYTTQGQGQHGQTTAPSSGGSVYGGSPTHSQGSHGHYNPAQQQQYYQQQQQYLQQQQAQQQQYYQQHGGQFFAQPQVHQVQGQQQQGMYPQAQGYYAAQQGQHAHGYYEPQAQYAAPHQMQQQQAQGYYVQGPSGGASRYGHGRPQAEQSNSYSNSNMYLNQEALSQNQGQGQQGQGPARVRRTGMTQPLTQNYMAAQGQYESAQPTGRRSQRNVSNQSNISEITSATLNELQADEDDEAEADETDATAADQDQDQEDQLEEEQAAANAAAMISGLRMDSTDDQSTASNRTPKSPLVNVNSSATQHLKSTLQIQPAATATAAQVPINCKLSEHRKRNVSAGSNTTEITAQMLYDLQQQEQRLEQEEADEGSQPSSPLKGSPRTARSPIKAASSSSAEATVSPVPSAPAGSPLPADASPRVTGTPQQQQPTSRAREASATLSIAPFTMSAEALDELQRQAEATDALPKPERRTRRNSSERSNHSDITAALAYMQIDMDAVDKQFLNDDIDDIASSADNSVNVNVCVCGKAGASSCPFGSGACACVYKAMY